MILCKSDFHREKLPKHRLGEMSARKHAFFFLRMAHRKCAMRFSKRCHLGTDASRLRVAFGAIGLARILIARKWWSG
jgi:hypothetical protein